MYQDQFWIVPPSSGSNEADPSRVKVDSPFAGVITAGSSGTTLTIARGELFTVIDRVVVPVRPSASVTCSVRMKTPNSLNPSKLQFGVVARAGSPLDRKRIEPSSRVSVHS